MKTFALLIACTCVTVAGLDRTAAAATPWKAFPPANLQRVQTTPFQLSSPVTKIGLNPQPLPPRVYTPYYRPKPGSKVSLNPQPLPPRIIRRF